MVPVSKSFENEFWLNSELAVFQPKYHPRWKPFANLYLVWNYIPRVDIIIKLAPSLFSFKSQKLFAINLVPVGKDYYKISCANEDILFGFIWWLGFQFYAHAKKRFEKHYIENIQEKLWKIITFARITIIHCTLWIVFIQHKENTRCLKNSTV